MIQQRFTNIRCQRRSFIKLFSRNKQILISRETFSQQKTCEICSYFMIVDENMAILDRDVRRLWSREIHMVKVQWARRPVEEATSEIDRDMRSQCPHMFEHSGKKVE